MLYRSAAMRCKGERKKAPSPRPAAVSDNADKADREVDWERGNA
jgi:hypothetical protein